MLSDAHHLHQQCGDFEVMENSMCSISEATA